MGYFANTPQGGQGYGGVYRTYDQAAFHQQVKDLPVGDPAVPHPKLGQWNPASRPDLTWPYVQAYYTWRADVPLVQVGPPAVPFGQASLPAQYYRLPPDFSAYGQRPPLTPQVVIPPTAIGFVTPWGLAMLHSPAYGRDWSVPLYTQRQDQLPVGNPAAIYARPGQWQPGTMDVEGGVYPAQAAQGAGDPPALFGLASLPEYFYGARTPDSLFAQRLPLVRDVVIPPPPIAFIPPWVTAAVHLPAYLRDWSIPLLTQRLDTLPVGDPAVLYSKAGVPPFLFLVPDRSIYRQPRPGEIPPNIVIPPVLMPATWALQQAVMAAYQRDWSVQLLTQRLDTMPIGAPPVQFPKLGAIPTAFYAPRGPYPEALQRPPLIPTAPPTLHGLHIVNKTRERLKIVNHSGTALRIVPHLRQGGRPVFNVLNPYADLEIDVEIFDRAANDGHWEDTTGLSPTAFLSLTPTGVAIGAATVAIGARTGDPNDYYGVIDASVLQSALLPTYANQNVYLILLIPGADRRRQAMRVGGVGDFDA